MTNREIELLGKYTAHIKIRLKSIKATINENEDRDSLKYRYSVIMLNSIQSSMSYILKEFIDTQNGKKLRKEV